MLTIIQFKCMSSSILLFGTSSRETLITKGVLNMDMRIVIYLNAEKYPCSCRVGSFIGTLKKLPKNSYCKGKKDLYTTNDHYHFKNFSTDSCVVVFIVPTSLPFIFNLLLSSRFLCC